MSTQTISTPQLRARRKKFALAVAIAVGLLFLLPLGLGGWFYFEARSVLPQLDGSIRISGVSAPVIVIRDAHGVPHIRASNMSDLAFAQGYVTAQDRLWQMDVTRRYAAGEMAEIFGPEWIKHDRAQRILSLQQVAQKSAAQLDPESRELFGHYAAGINEFIETHRDRLPLEFRILRYRPRPWTLEDAFLIGANMAEFLNHDEFEQKLAREKITQKIGSDLAADLFPNKSWHDRPPESQARVQRNRRPPSDDDSTDENDDPSADMDVTRLFSSVGEMGDVLRPGSNNWVVSGAHTVSGKPLLSNDMHLHHQIPNVWYEAHLIAGDFDVAGVTLPGLPFVIAGHNRRIAWGFTNLGPDVEDIYVEHFNSSGQYQTPSGWREPQRRQEIIHAKGEKDVVFDVLSTRHGPIVSELAPEEHRQIALKWTLYEFGMSSPFQKVDGAQNWQEFRAAFQSFTSPGQNVVYADVDGNIGYQATGVVPLRFTGNGALPVEGNVDLYEWTGYIPFEKLPSIFNPPSGVLATANGRIVSDHYPYVLSNEWDAPFRTERIFNVLSSGRKFSAADMLALQTDIYSAFDLACAQKFADAVDRDPHSSARARKAAEILHAWDGRLSKESAAATIELLARREVTHMVLEPKIGALWKEYIWYNAPVALENLLLHQPKAWLTQGYTNYDQLLAAALEKTVNEPGAPSRLDSWRRGSEFPLEIQHPIFGRIPVLQRWAGPGTVEQSGGGLTVKQVGRSFGPSERMTADFADLDSSTLNIVTGQSGEISSPYYMDQWKAWYEGTTFTLPFSQPAVDRAATHTLQLAPVSNR